MASFGLAEDTTLRQDQLGTNSVLFFGLHFDGSRIDTFSTAVPSRLGQAAPFCANAWLTAVVMRPPKDGGGQDIGPDMTCVVLFGKDSRNNAQLVQ